MKYTKTQIQEALDYWQNKLDEAKQIDERRMSRSELDTFLSQLGRGRVTFEYMKKERDAQGNPTGNLIRRTANGTRREDLIPAADYQELQRLLSQPRAAYMIYYYDLDSHGIRQFNVNHFERTISAPRAFEVKYEYYARETSEDEIIANSSEEAIREFTEWAEDRESKSTDKDFSVISVREI